MLWTFALQAVLPVGLLLWLALGRHPSRVAWILTLTLVLSALGVLRLVAVWLVLPWYLPALYAILAIPAAAYSLRAVRGRPPWPRGATARALTVLRAIGAAAGIATVAYAWTGRRPPGEPVDVEFPLHQGTYLVANGGGIALVNAHLATLTGERFRAYRGQSYGVDLVRVDGWGRRARGFQPRDPRAYTIFGDSVFAPCAGRVVRAEDGIADQPVPEVNREHMAGNHVLLDCGTAWVLLGHFQNGSTRVRTGQAVPAGTPLGQVGNTGNTSEPHLHVHAQRPGTAAMPLGGVPLAIRLGGRYLVRNARVTVRR